MVVTVAESETMISQYVMLMVNITNSCKDDRLKHHDSIFHNRKFNSEVKNRNSTFVCGHHHHDTITPLLIISDLLCFQSLSSGNTEIDFQ